MYISKNGPYYKRRSNSSFEHIRDKNLSIPIRDELGSLRDEAGNFNDEVKSIIEGGFENKETINQEFISQVKEIANKNGIEIDFSKIREGMEKYDYSYIISEYFNKIFNKKNIYKLDDEQKLRKQHEIFQLLIKNNVSFQDIHEILGLQNKIAHDFEIKDTILELSRNPRIKKEIINRLNFIANSEKDFLYAIEYGEGFDGEDCQSTYFVYHSEFHNILTVLAEDFLIFDPDNRFEDNYNRENIYDVNYKKWYQGGYGNTTDLIVDYLKINPDKLDERVIKYFMNHRGDIREN